MEIAQLFEQLFDKNNTVAYRALRQLQQESRESSRVYPYMDRLAELLESGSSYLRTRGLTLIAENARWDVDNRVDEVIDRYLRHIADPKPITARQCIQLLPTLAAAKPELRETILSALHRADVARYGDSMGPLVYKDIRRALEEIEAL